MRLQMITVVMSNLDPNLVIDMVLLIDSEFEVCTVKPK